MDSTTVANEQPYKIIISKQEQQQLYKEFIVFFTNVSDKINNMIDADPNNPNNTRLRNLVKKIQNIIGITRQIESGNKMPEIDVGTDGNQSGGAKILICNWIGVLFVFVLLLILSSLFSMFITPQIKMLLDTYLLYFYSIFNINLMNLLTNITPNDFLVNFDKLLTIFVIGERTFNWVKDKSIGISVYKKLSSVITLFLNFFCKIFGFVDKTKVQEENRQLHLQFFYNNIFVKQKTWVDLGISSGSYNMSQLFSFLVNNETPDGIPLSIEYKDNINDCLIKIKNNISYLLPIINVDIIKDNNENISIDSINEFNRWLQMPPVIRSQSIEYYQHNGDNYNPQITTQETTLYPSVPSFDTAATQRVIAQVDTATPIAMPVNNLEYATGPSPILPMAQFVSDRRGEGGKRRSRKRIRKRKSKRGGKKSRIRTKKRRMSRRKYRR